MLTLETGLSRTEDEVVVLVDGVTNLLAVRRIADSEVFQSVVGVPEFLSQLWHQHNAQTRAAGFTLHKVHSGWTARWRKIAATIPSEKDMGNRSFETDYHAWLVNVNASLPMPTP